MTHAPEQFGPALVAAARRHVGAPYRHHGRGLLGLDCLGLYLVCLWELQIPVPDFRDYSTDVSAYTLRERVGERMTELADWRRARAGDILLSVFHPRLPASHLMIVAEADDARGPLRVVHASNARAYGRRVVEHNLAHRERIVCAFRWPGAAGGGDAWRK